MFWLAINAITTALKAYSTYSAAKAKTKALERERDIKIKQRERRTKALAGSQKASFLQSGIALTGAGTPQALFDETYDIGIEDVNLLSENYHNKIQSIQNQARSEMIGQISEFALNTASYESPGSSSISSSLSSGGGGNISDITLRREQPSLSDRYLGRY